MKIFHIVAASTNDIIGNQGDLPWHIPLDLQNFKKTTLNHPIIMGRKTFASFKRPLPNRQHLVISRQDPTTQQDAVIWVKSLTEAINLCKLNSAKWGEEIYIIGGGEIYRQSMDLVDEILLTRVHKTIVGDTSYPALPQDDFALTWQEDHFDCDPPFSFLRYCRVDHSKT
jgi:dihydrofolate reductase